MALETEVKVRVEPAEMAAVREHLAKEKARVRRPKAEEKNLLFDFPDGRLQRSGCTLRLRVYGDEALLTFKGRIQQDPHFKKRPEHQTRISDPAAARAIFSGLGLQVCFRYDKLREIREWNLGDWTVEVSLDETPVGNYVEIEGEPDGIREAARILGWTPDRFIRKSYVQLYQEELGSGEPGRGNAGS